MANYSIVENISATRGNISIYRIIGDVYKETKMINFEGTEALPPIYTVPQFIFVSEIGYMTIPIPCSHIKILALQLVSCVCIHVRVYKHKRDI